MVPEYGSASRGLRRLRPVCLFVLLLFTLALNVQSAAAQAVSGTLLGTVTDNTGGVLPGAIVTITHIETGRVRTVTADENGEFAAPSLSTGTYSVKAELTGFKTVTLTEVHLGVDQRVRVDPKLEVGAMTEAVEIIASAPLVQTSSSDLASGQFSRCHARSPLIGPLGAISRRSSNHTRSSSNRRSSASSEEAETSTWAMRALVLPTAEESDAPNADSTRTYSTPSRALISFGDGQWNNVPGRPIR